MTFVLTVRNLIDDSESSTRIDTLDDVDNYAEVLGIRLEVYNTPHRDLEEELHKLVKYLSRHHLDATVTVDNRTPLDRFNDKIQSVLQKEPLQKSVHDLDWRDFIRRGEPDKVVDHAQHAADTAHIVPQGLKDLLEGDLVAISAAQRGISPKLVYDYEDDKPWENSRWGGMPHTSRVMVKPYHHSQPGQPATYGWASVVFPALMKAANIGHLSDTVGVHVHNGVPVSVHPFESDVTSMASLYDRGLERPHIQDAMKIAIMDTLSDNQDRHGNNLMIRNKDHTPMAIDNEQAFQYGMFRPLDAHWRNDATGRMYRTEEEREHIPAVAKWWVTHKDAIKNEFTKQLGSITDEKVKKNILSGFNHQHDHITRMMEPIAAGKRGATNPFGSGYVSDPVGEQESKSGRHNGEYEITFNTPEPKSKSTIPVVTAASPWSQPAAAKPEFTKTKIAKKTKQSLDQT